MENLLNRVALGRKLLILGLLALCFVAIPTVQNLRHARQDVVTAQTKASAVAPIKSLLRVIQLAQQHRGMSSALLGGNASFADKRAAKQIELDQAIDKMDTVIARELAVSAVTSAWTPAAKDWKGLATAVSGKSLSSKESFARHTAMIGAFIGALDELMFHFGLAADTDVASAQMVSAVAIHLPNLTEVLGQARARGTNHLGQKTITPQDRIALASLIDLSALHHTNMSKALVKAINADRSLADSLGTLAKESSDQATSALKLAREQLVEAETLSYPPTDYFAATTNAIDAQFKLSDKAFDLLAILLNRRASEANSAYYMLLGGFVILLLLIGITELAHCTVDHTALGGSGEGCQRRRSR